MCRVSCLAVIFLEIEWAYSREKVAMGVVEMRVRVSGNTAIFLFFYFFYLVCEKNNSGLATPLNIQHLMHVSYSESDYR